MRKLSWFSKVENTADDAADAMRADRKLIKLGGDGVGGGSSAGGMMEMGTLDGDADANMI